MSSGVEAYTIKNELQFGIKYEYVGGFRVEGIRRERFKTSKEIWLDDGQLCSCK